MLKRIGAAAFAALVLASGCASNKSSTSASAADGPHAPQPSGPPIVVGLTNQEGSPSGSWPELRVAAQAAVDYINNQLGGLFGRPLKLNTCVTDGSPEGSTKCANTILASNPVVVLGGADVGADASMPIYTKAGMPFLGGVPITMSLMRAPNSVQFSGFAVGGLPAMAAYAADTLHAKKAIIVHPGLPGTEEFIGALMKPVLMAKGATSVTMLGSDVAQPDKTAVMTAAAQSKPDVIFVIDAGAGCVSTMQSHAMLAPNIPLLITGDCLEGGFLATAGQAAEGVYGQEEFLADTDPANPDVRVFTAAMKKYAPANTPNTAFSADGFAGVMNIYNGLKALSPTDLNAAAILKAFTTETNAPNFMGEPYTCDHHVRMAPSVCNVGNRIIQVKGGKLVDVSGDWFDAWKSMS
jgi:branched-chain amino acid transport system substrate-binding protein